MPPTGTLKLTFAPGDDELAVTSTGEPLDSRRTVGWNSAVNLGQHKPERAVVSPENMCFFAAPMYFKEWHWGSGLAKKCPEEDDFDPVSEAQSQISWRMAC